MARVALALCLLLALTAAARAAPSEYTWEDPEAAAADVDEEVAAAAVEEERTGRETEAEEQWQDEEAETLDGDAYQEEYQQRDNSEPLTQQLEDTQVVQESDEGSLSRLTADQQSDQQQQQRTNDQLQQDQQQRTNDQLQQDQQQRTNDQQQNQGRLPDRIVEQPQGNPTGSNPPRDNDFGIVGNNGNVQQPQPANQQPGNQQPASYPPQRPGADRPPPGYSSVGFFGYFKVVKTPMTWIEALMTCYADGARLAVPTEEREALAVGEFYGKVKNDVKKSADKDLFFIGASDIHKESSFATVLGTQFGQNQWFRWQKGEPNNHKKSEHCVLSNDRGFYWDGNCLNKYAFVCEFKDRCRPGSPRFNEPQQSADLQQQTQSQTRY